MKLSQLKLSPVNVSVSGIEQGDYFATDILGFAMVFRCRTYAHGVLFDDRQEPHPFRAQECFAVLDDIDTNIQKLQHQCMVDRNRALGIKAETKEYVEVKSQELVAKYKKNKRN